jgi:hypothetical protein
VAGTRRRKLYATRVGISEHALDAWQPGDKHACHQALGIMPFQWSPFDVDGPEPPEYMLEEERRGTDKAYGAASWRRAWELRQALCELAGEPGPFDRHGRPLGVILPPSERSR